MMSSDEPRRSPKAGAEPVPAPGRIRRLSGALVDQIAAGEVVERPASVVKELVENALDAGAGRIRVECRGGGRDWIAVTDDGSGMGPDDARLALERHATSKIASADDLSRIGTFGFRGEALAAIASVSVLRLRSRPLGASEAIELRVSEGEITSVRSVGAPEGTRVEVAELFRGVPARRKFLKTAVTEWGHVADFLARAALALPHVHFDLQRDDRPATTWPATKDALDRVAAIVRDADAAAFTPVSREEGGAAVSGFVSRPEHHRGTGAGIYLFVNRRPVRDRLLQHALVEVYRDLLPRGRFPAAVLFVALPLDRVDVNVHPAKREVRFADPQAIHALIRHAVRDAVSVRGWLGARPGPPRPPGAAGWGERLAGGRAGRDGQDAAGARSSTGTTTDWTFARVGEPLPEAAPGVEFATATPAAARVRFADLRLLGQLLATYLVLETKDQLLLIDQHAAHERVLFERLRAEWTQRGVESQQLLVPTTVQLDPTGHAALLQCGEGTRGLGFDWEDFGDGTVAIRAVPALLGARDPGHLLRSLTDELAEAGPAADALRTGSRSLEAADRVFASLACHSARRKGDILDPIEQRALLDALDAIPWAPCCPHGRPVSIPIELSEIERRFARR